MSKTYQTEIHIHSYHSYSVQFTRRAQPEAGYGRYFDKEYTPTATSRRRLEKTVSNWINKNWAEISITGNSLFIEVTGN